MSEIPGRRPDGPGWYWYEGVYRFREHEVLFDNPIEVTQWECEELGVYLMAGDFPIDYMPGDFTPLPAPAPAWGQAPPSTPGDWWVWHLSRMRLKPILRHLLLYGGDLVYFEPWPGGRIDVVRIADLPDDTWWCEADIPICPAGLEFLRSVGLTADGMPVTP